MPVAQLVSGAQPNFSTLAQMANRMPRASKRSNRSRRAKNPRPKGLDAAAKFLRPRRNGVSRQVYWMAGGSRAIPPEKYWRRPKEDSATYLQHSRRKQTAPQGPSEAGGQKPLPLGMIPGVGLRNPIPVRRDSVGPCLGLHLHPLCRVLSTSLKTGPPTPGPTLRLKVIQDRTTRRRRILASVPPRPIASRPVVRKGRPGHFCVLRTQRPTSNLGATTNGPRQPALAFEGRGGTLRFHPARGVMGPRFNSIRNRRQQTLKRVTIQRGPLGLCPSR